MKAALQAYVDRTNAGDADGLLSLFSPDAYMEDPVGTPRKYRDEMAKLFRDGAAYGARIEIVAPIRGSHGNEAAVVFDVCYTPPGGPRLRIRSLDVCTFDEGGRITSLRAFWGPDDVSEEPAATAG
jgi:steroid delta-isomerase